MASAGIDQPDDVFTKEEFIVTCTHYGFPEHVVRAVVRDRCMTVFTSTAVAHAVNHVLPYAVQPPPTLLSEEERAKIVKKLESRFCVVCKEHKADILILPCAHMVGCRSCVSELTNCPCCDKRILGTVNTFMV